LGNGPERKRPSINQESSVKFEKKFHARNLQKEDSYGTSNQKVEEGKLLKEKKERGNRGGTNENTLLGDRDRTPLTKENEGKNSCGSSIRVPVIAERKRGLMKAGQAVIASIARGIG